MTIKALYPTVRPTLNLDFAKTKVLDPRITFTRASTATFVGANGLIQTAASGAARFDHNPATGESLGLLVEEARANLALRSEEFNNAYWTLGPLTITANATTAPDGTITADKATPNNGSTSNDFSINRVFTGLSGSTTGSVYVKSAGWRYVRLGGYVLDLLSTQNGTNSTYVGNGWHRLYEVYSAATVAYAINVTATTPGTSYTGNGTDGIYVWGAQVEAGSFATSYIPTTSATVTRAADVASMTGTSFSGWYNNAQGSIFTAVATRCPASTTNPGFIYQFTDGTVTNRIETGQQGSGASSPRVGGLFRTANSTTATWLTTETNWTTNGAVTDASILSFNSSGVSFYTTYGTAVTTTGSYPTNLTQVTFGHSGTYKRLAFYPVRLPDAQLQALTAT